MIESEFSVRLLLGQTKNCSQGGTSMVVVVVLIPEISLRIFTADKFGNILQITGLTNQKISGKKVVYTGNILLIKLHSKPEKIFKVYL